VGLKWIFGHERNGNNEVVRCKAKLVAQGFVAQGFTHKFVIAILMKHILQL
jgi:hypothetical protein